MDFQSSILWKNSLANKKYKNDELRDRLIKDYLRTRENAQCVLKKIRNDFPNLTVHDISHTDGLWQVASVITGADYDINPLEGFILGCAFLMHDAVLSYDAAGGVEHLRSRLEWKDYYEDFKSDDSLNESEKEYEADFCTIRRLHAKYAEGLYDQLFVRPDGSSFYIIENKSIRDHYGDIICRIAGSHHWEIGEVAKLSIQFAATPDYPQEWRVNPMKLACILRCADAGHIDAGRAPDYLMELLKVNGVSKDHWIAQNRLSQIDIDINRQGYVLIQSNISFREEDFSAWNVAYDAVRVLNHELKTSNELLKKNGICEFYAKGVSGAESREELSEYIKTDGWQPFDAEVHISNVEKLIKNLGGEKLYGKEHKIEIVLRELLQNARDAICARRKIETGYYGKILVSIENSDGKTWISVQDNGVGMSIDAVKNYFLNFGSSYWASDLAKKEFTGLNSSGFRAVGQFGIGFYSIFMVAEKVIVNTRRYDASLDDNLVLKFPTGLSMRPIIAHKRGLTNVSTVIKFLIDETKENWNDTFVIKPSVVGAEAFTVPYSSIVKHITAGLDVDVYYKEFDEKEKLVHKNINNILEGSKELKDWLKDISYAEYRKNALYLDYIEANYKRLRKLSIEGNNYGLAAINTCWQSQYTFLDVSTVGGLANVTHGSDNGDYIGYIDFEPMTASRDKNDGSIDRTEWAIEQYRLLRDAGLSDLDKLFLPYVLGKYGIDLTGVMLISYYGKDNQVQLCGLKDLVFDMARRKLKFVIGLASWSGVDRADNHMDAFRTKENINEDEILFAPVRNSGFLNVKQNDREFPANILWCFEKICEEVGLSMDKNKEFKKIISNISGYGDAIVISVY